MIHTVCWRVGSEDALDFWEGRLESESDVVERDDGVLTFEDPEGLRHELAVVDTNDAPLVAKHPEIPAELALRGFDAVRAYAVAPDASRSYLEDALRFAPIAEDAWEVRGETRGGGYVYDPAPAERGIGGAGTVHHVAWASTMEDHEPWRERIQAAGLRPTPIIDRFWFRSIYFREPNGILFEIATVGPGFAVDEDLAHLGESLVLPPAFEHLREQIEARLTPLELPASSRR
jgi:glyoxalase family protein